MTFREWCFGPTQPPTPSEAARALSAHARRADRERIRETTARLRWEIAHGITAPLGWKS